MQIPAELKNYYSMKIYQTEEIKNIALLGSDGSGKDDPYGGAAL